jgi:hypothetical protein
MDRDERKEDALPPELIASLGDGPEPDPALEETVVAALRAHGLLGAEQAGVALQAESPAERLPADAPKRDIRPLLRRRAMPWLAGALAASVAFLAGMRLGEHSVMPAPETPPAATAAAAPADTTLLATRVDETAADYVLALAQVQNDQLGAREAAIRTFRTASDQILRIAPESDLAFAIRIAFPMSFADSPATLAMLSPPTQVIWY